MVSPAVNDAFGKRMQGGDSRQGKIIVRCALFLPEPVFKLACGISPTHSCESDERHRGVDVFTEDSHNPCDQRSCLSAPRAGEYDKGGTPMFDDAPLVVTGKRHDVT